MEYNSSGVFKAESVIGVNTVLSQFLHKSTVQFRHFETIQKAVHPVQFPGYPVNCKAFSMQNPIDNHFSVTAIIGHSLNHSAAHIDPIKALVNAIKVQSHHTGQPLQDERVSFPVRWQIPQVITVAEDKVRWDVAVLAAAMAVWLSQESGSTFTNVGAHSVLADLTAHSGCLPTLIDVITRFAVRHEAIARATGADKAGGRVSAVVITVMDWRVCAFIDTYSRTNCNNIEIVINTFVTLHAFFMCPQRDSQKVNNVILFRKSHSPHPFSSLLSEQSSFLSHTRLTYIQCPLSHLNSPGGQVGAGVWHMCSSSSDSSPQSLSPSHTKSRIMHRPFWQVNWCCWHAW